MCIGPCQGQKSTAHSVAAALHCPCFLPHDLLLCSTACMQNPSCYRAIRAAVQALRRGPPRSLASCQVDLPMHLPASPMPEGRRSRSPPRPPRARTPANEQGLVCGFCQPCSIHRFVFLLGGTSSSDLTSLCRPCPCHQSIGKVTVMHHQVLVFLRGTTRPAAGDDTRLPVFPLLDTQQQTG